MIRNKYHYFTLLHNGNFANDVSSHKLPTYPHAMRFKSYEDMLHYRDAKKQFVQSTKIPESCDECPIRITCLALIPEDARCHGDFYCRVSWRKIWEYVK